MKHNEALHYKDSWGVSACSSPSKRNTQDYRKVTCFFCKPVNRGNTKDVQTSST